MTRPRWNLALRSRSPALLGAARHEESGVHLAAGTIRLDGDDADRTLLVGSTLRGVLRHDLVRLLAARGDHPCERTPSCGCVACRLFGAPGRPGKLAVRSATAPATSRHAVTRVAIDRVRRTASRESRLLWSELRLQADFHVALEALEPLGAEEAAAVDLLLAWEQAVGVRLGHARRAGAGAFQLAWSRAEDAAPTPRRGGADAERHRYAVRFIAEEPLRIVGLRQRAFLSVSADVVPATAVRGAIGWALVRAGAPEIATDLFRERAIRVGGAARRPAGELPVAGVLVCRHGHRLDTTAHQVAVALGHDALWPFECPHCRGPLKIPKGERPERLLLGHTAIDPETLRPASGQLFHHLTLPPGTVLVAEAEMSADQAEAVAGLGQVLLGAGRARGTGRARVEVEALAPVPPLQARLDRTAEALRRVGVADPTGIAVFAFVADGWCAEPLSRLLERRGLRLVTGNARRVLQGGWDLERDAQRPLRTLVGAGSWVAVRGPTDAVAELEATGVADPEGTHPLWLRVRDLQGETE